MPVLTENNYLSKLFEIIKIIRNYIFVEKNAFKSNLPYMQAIVNLARRQCTHQESKYSS